MLAGAIARFVMVITAPIRTSRKDVPTHLELKGVSMTQAPYTRFAETDAANIVERKRADNSLVYACLALLAIGSALVAGWARFDHAAPDNPNIIDFPIL